MFNKRATASLIKLNRLYSTKATAEARKLDKLRNIGILAHIDAGKTTTTERMLYYSGCISQMGEVHHGNTVTDYMEQERERGITITSAAVTFNWKTHQFNLIDTPGHIDFTMEVEQTLSVLDGAIVVLDGTAGVEAQTLTVWKQADRYSIPRIVFVNKMDRPDAGVCKCCESIEHKLQKPSLCLQIPLYENKTFFGLVDILSMQKLSWTTSGKEKKFTECPLTEENEPKLWTEAKKARADLIDKISSFNDTLADQIIKLESLEDIQTVNIMQALRSITLERKAVAVVCGSAYKNVGMQPLMDAVIDYLPSPLESNQHFRAFGESLCAKAFKVRHSRQMGGALVYFRLYSGTFKKGQKIYNVQRECSEQAGKLYAAYADDLEEVDGLSNGNIAVVAGLKETMSGDLVTNSATSAQNAKKKMLQSIAGKKEASTAAPEATVEALFTAGAKIPEPVFFCSVEPPSPAFQSGLEQALRELQREDPSLRVRHDEETDQTILAGMGELHLEIIRDRLLCEYKIDADIGQLQIAYREAPVKSATGELKTDIKVGKTSHLVRMRLSVLVNATERTELLVLDKTPEAAPNIANIYHKHLLGVKQGIVVGVSRGPKINSQVVNVQVMLHLLEVGRGTAETFIASTATQLVQKLLREADTYILEPVMKVEIVTPESCSSAILSDLNRRRSSIVDISYRENYKVINVIAPLAELLGYSTVIRSISSGSASFNMEFLQYQKLSVADETNAIQKVRGF